MHPRNILVILAIIIVVVWAIEFFIYSIGAIIHTLLLVAAVLLIIRYKRWKKRRKDQFTDRMKIKRP